MTKRPSIRARKSLPADESGYTLVEMAAALAVASVALSMATFFLLSVAATVERGQRQADVVRTTHAALRQVAAELRAADRVAPSPDGWISAIGSRTIQYASGGGRLNRDGRPFYTSAHVRLEASVLPVVVRDTLRGHRFEIAAFTASADGPDRRVLALSTAARARAPASWTEIPGR